MLDTQQWDSWRMSTAGNDLCPGLLVTGGIGCIMLSNGKPMLSCKGFLKTTIINTTKHGTISIVVDHHYVGKRGILFPKRTTLFFNIVPMYVIHMRILSPSLSCIIHCKTSKPTLSSIKTT